MANSMNTERQLAVVTGASSGIGYELARNFAENDFDLIIASGSNAITTAAEKLRNEFGGSVQEVQTDLSTYEGVDKLYGFIKSYGQPVDAIAINAGVGVGGAFTATLLHEELAMIDLNVKSVVHLSKHVIGDMAARNKGKVLFTASVVSDIPSPYQSVYSATKAFVLNFAEAIRAELKEEGSEVTITALQPGATETNFFSRAGIVDAKITNMKKDDPADVARDGFKAMMDGDQKVVAHSMMSKAMGVMGKVMPDKTNAAAMVGINKPGSASN